MLVIKLMSKPNVEDRYRHHGEGEKDPKGEYAYAGCELAPKHYKPGGAPDAGFHTDGGPGTRPRDRPPPATSQPFTSRSGPGRGSRHM